MKPTLRPEEMVEMSSSDSPEETNFIPAIDDTEELTASDLTAVENLREGSAMLLVQRGPDAGSRFLLDDDAISVGRHPTSDIFLDDISVSRRHATFRRSPQGYVVSDLGSLNGTYINRDRIDTDVTLTGGDEVRIGKYRLIYFAGSVPSGGDR